MFPAPPVDVWVYNISNQRNLGGAVRWPGRHTRISTAPPHRKRYTVPKPKVLIVDDDATTSKTYSLHLEQVGYDCVAAPNAGTALALAPVFRPDVALIDMTLPDADGANLIHDLKALDIPNLIVIVASARSRYQDITALMRLGVYEYLVKPFELTLLSSTISLALSRKYFLNQMDDLREAVAEATRRATLAEHDAAQARKDSDGCKEMGKKLLLQIEGMEKRIQRLQPLEQWRRWTMNALLAGMAFSMSVYAFQVGAVTQENFFTVFVAAGALLMAGYLLTSERMRGLFVKALGSEVKAEFQNGTGGNTNEH